jgi:hypothetical protein
MVPLPAGRGALVAVGPRTDVGARTVAVGGTAVAVALGKTVAVAEGVAGGRVG